MAVRKPKSVEANDGSYGGMVLAAFDSLPAQPVDVLAVADLRLLNEVHHANRTFGTPHLPSPGKQKRAKKLLAAGLLVAHEVGLTPNPEAWIAVSVSAAGIDAYNAAIARMGKA